MTTLWCDVLGSEPHFGFVMLKRANGRFVVTASLYSKPLVQTMNVT